MGKKDIFISYSRRDLKAVKSLVRRIEDEVHQVPWVDLHGNVYEWCQDWNGDYSDDILIDPTGPVTGYSRIFRGGCWGASAQFCRSAYRAYGSPTHKYRTIGLRLVCSTLLGDS